MWSIPENVPCEIEKNVYSAAFGAEYIMRNAGLDDAQARIKIAGRNITLMAESKELKSLLMKAQHSEN